MKTTAHLAIAALALAASVAQAADAVVTSPNGRVAMRIADDGATFSINRSGEAVIASSPMGLELDGQALGALTLESRQDVAVEASSPGAAAGLQPRDAIVSAAQQPIRDVATLQSLLAAGPRVERTIVRNQARVLLHWLGQAT